MKLSVHSQFFNELPISGIVYFLLTLPVILHIIITLTNRVIL